MGPESPEDRLIFLEEFGAEHTIRLKLDEGDREIIGIFDREHAPLDFSTSSSLSDWSPQRADGATSVPVLWARSDDLEGLPRSQGRVEINGEIWLTDDIQPDGTGMSVVILHKG